MALTQFLKWMGRGYPLERARRISIARLELHHPGQISFTVRLRCLCKMASLHTGNSAKVSSPQPNAAPVTSRSRAENTNGPAIIA